MDPSGELCAGLSNLSAVKIIVRIFKLINWNYNLDDGKGLLQEVDTRFGTTYVVVERFLLSGSTVCNIIAASDSDTGKNAASYLLNETVDERDQFSLQWRRS